MQTEAFTILSLGFILGLKHALDADHLIAVATIVSERKKLFSSSVVGMLWGAGHTASLLVVGFIVIFLKIQVPHHIALAMEFSVAAMLVLLGVSVLWKVIRGEVVHVHVHEHHGHKHVHPHIHPVKTDHDHPKEESHHTILHGSLTGRVRARIANNSRPLFVGMVHGLAGSAALMLIVLATITSTELALLYIAVFGVGSIGGMILMSTVISVPFVMAARQSYALQRAVRVVAGVASVGFGLYLGWQIGWLLV